MCHGGSWRHGLWISSLAPSSLVFVSCWSLQHEVSPFELVHYGLNPLKPCQPNKYLISPLLSYGCQVLWPAVENWPIQAPFISDRRAVMKMTNNGKCWAGAEKLELHMLLLRVKSGAGSSENTKPSTGTYSAPCHIPRRTGNMY